MAHAPPRRQAAQPAANMARCCMALVTPFADDGRFGSRVPADPCRRIPRSGDGAEKDRSCAVGAASARVAARPLCLPSGANTIIS